MLCNLIWLYLGQIRPPGLSSWNACHVDFCWNCNKPFLNLESWIYYTCSTIRMMTPSNGNIFRVTCPLWGESTGQQRPVTRSFDVFMEAWTNGWANNQDACDYRRHRAHYDVTIMNWGIDTLDSPVGLWTVIQSAVEWVPETPSFESWSQSPEEDNLSPFDS